MAALSSVVRQVSATAERPNILFVFSDDHSLQTIGAYRTRLQAFINRHQITPQLNRLAAGGAVLERSYCCNSLCGPSRAAILTGLHSHANGFIDNRSTFDGSQWTVAKALQAAGYETAIIGKWHLVSTPTGFGHWEILPGQGNYYNPDFITPAGTERRSGYVTDLIGDAAIRFLRQRDRAKPFLLMCHHKAPHRPWMPPERYLTLLERETVPEPDTLFDDYAGRAAPASEQLMEIGRDMTLPSDLKVRPPLATAQGLTGEFGRMTDAQKVAWDAAYVPRNEAFTKANLSDRALTRWKYQAYMKDYLRCVKAVDDNVGRLLDELRDQGLEQSTVVIYASDQGFYNGEHGWFDKRWMYEESLSMPFLVRWPGHVAAGGRLRPMVQNIDYAPTMLEMAGEPVPTGLHGRSFRPVLEGRTPRDWRTSVYYHYYEYPQDHRVQAHVGVRTDRYKLVYYYPVNQWELFDLDTDPHELRSVYADPAYASIVADLKVELDRLRREYAERPYPMRSDSR
jgi:arylsulfatase A-like enzyme